MTLDEGIIIDTEAILAELRATRNALPDAVREYIYRYYPAFAELRQVGRLCEIIREKFGVEITRMRVQNLWQKGARHE